MTEGIPTVLQEQVDSLANTQTDNGAPASAPAEPVTPPTTPPADDDASPVEPQVLEEAQTQGAQVLGNTAQAPRSADDVDPWKHRYDVINGKYVAETGRLRQESQAKDEEIANLRKQADNPLPDDSPGGNPIPSPQSISDDEVKKYVTAELIEEFGIDYWKQQVALQKAMQVPPPQADSSRIQQVEQRLENQSRQTFYTELTDLVSNWRQINSSSAWNDFLGQFEELTGATYEALLIDAYDNFDSVRVSQLFQRFSSLHKPGNNANADNAVIGNQVVPTPVHNSQSPDAVNSSTISFGEWNRQMQELASGGLPPMQVVEAQKKLMTAWREGRVTGAVRDANGVSPSFV